jgi:EmrB/QacA subfamily drug resistance transporter
MGSSVNVALPAIGKEFSMNAILLGWVPTSYILAAAMFLIPLGRFADIHGRRAVFLCGIITYAASSFMTAVSQSAIFFLVGRVVQGIGSAMLFGTGVAILTSVFPLEQRGRVLGINVAGVYLGLSLGPFLGGLLTQHLGWRSIFYVNGSLGIIMIVLTIWKLKDEWAEAKGERYDLVGALLFMLMLFLFMFGLSLLPLLSGFWLLAGASLLAFGLVHWETRNEAPILNIGMFRKNVVFAFSNIAALINYSATAAVGFLLSLYLQYIKGFSPQIAGLILVSQPAIMTVFSPLAGKLSDRIEPRVVASTGMGFTAAGLLSLILLKDETTVGYIIFSLLLLGFGFALFSSPNTNAIMSSVDRKFYGVASSTLGTMRLMGQMLSLGIVMFFFSIFVGRVQITPVYYSVFLNCTKLLFAFFTITCCAGIFASLARGRLR